MSKPFYDYFEVFLREWSGPLSDRCSGPAADERQHVVAVLLDLVGTDAVDRPQRAFVCRLVLGDELEGGVGEDDVGRHLVVARPLQPPGLEPVIEALVVADRVVGAPPPLLLGSRAEGLTALTAARDLA